LHTNQSNHGYGLTASKGAAANREGFGKASRQGRRFPRHRKDDGQRGKLRAHRNAEVNSEINNASRSYAPITIEDLKRLRDIEAKSRREFFERQPKCVALANRVICVALCQGAALHHLNGKNGIKDFDVWTFYSALPGIEFPCRWRAQQDYGDPKFGKSPDRLDFIGRRVDLMGRSLAVDIESAPEFVLRRYLSEKHTTSSRFLSEKAAIMLEPINLLGTCIWP